MYILSLLPGRVNAVKQKIQGFGTTKLFTARRKSFNIFAQHTIVFALPIYFVKIKLVKRCELYSLNQ